MKASKCNFMELFETGYKNTAKWDRLQWNKGVSIPTITPQTVILKFLET